MSAEGVSTISRAKAQASAMRVASATSNPSGATSRTADRSRDL